jgi:hypothetical protein
VYEIYKDCLAVLNAVKKMLIEMPISIIAYRALGYISKVGVTVNMPKLKLRTFASVDRNAMMTKEATFFNRW